MNDRFELCRQHTRLWLLSLAAACLLGGVGTARAAGEPLSASWAVHGGGRSGAPRNAAVTLLWNGTALLEGDLCIDIMAGRALVSRSVLRDLALAPGAQTFSLLLPAAAVHGNGREAQAHLRFRIGSREIDLAKHACSVPTRSQRLLSVLYPLPLIDRTHIQELASILRPDWLNPEPGRDTFNALRSGLAAVPPDAFPATPEAYCAHDVVLLAGTGIGKLRTQQLAALRTWVRAGGSLCVINPKELPTAHQTFLSELFADASGQPTLLFDVDGRPQGPRTTLRHLGIGRAALLLDDALDFDTLRQDEPWRKLLAFTWKLRAKQSRHVTEKGTWDAQAEDMETATDNRGSHNLRNHMRQYRNQLALQPLDFPSSCDYLSVLMPRDMSFVKMGSLSMILIMLVVLVGPVDYFLLKRLRLQRFTWLTVPLYVALATMAIVVLANNAMGRHDRRGKLCVLDTDVSGTPVRQNDITLMVPSSHGKLREHVSRALVAPVVVGGSSHGMQTASGSESAPQIKGRYPSDFDTESSVSQWQPLAWREMSLQPSASFPWQLPQEQAMWSDQGRKAFWRRFQELNGTLPNGAFLLRDGKMQTLRNERWKEATGLGDQHPARLVSLTEAPRIGYFSIVSAVSPACDPAMEDIHLYDITDVNQTVLVLVWQKDGIIFTSRTPFYRINHS